MRVHVSIHDVAPPFRAEVEAALGLTEAAGVKAALLVVPNFHGTAPLERDPSFAAFLRDRQDAGHEILLHGLTHRAAGREPSLSRFVSQRLVSDGEAEMSGLSRAEAEERLDAGMAVLARVGLDPEGFVPPAWTMPSWLVDLLGARGVRYTEDHLRVYDPAGRRARASLVLNYATRSRARAYATVAFCRAALPLARLTPTRIAVHPKDMHVPLVRDEIVRLLARARGSFVARGPDLLS